MASLNRSTYADILAGWRQPLLKSAANWELEARQHPLGSEARHYAERLATKLRRAAECLRDDDGPVVLEIGGREGAAA